MQVTRNSGRSTTFHDPVWKTFGHGASQIQNSVNSNPIFTIFPQVTMVGRRLWHGEDGSVVWESKVIH